MMSYRKSKPLGLCLKEKTKRIGRQATGIADNKKISEIEFRESIYGVFIREWFRPDNALFEHILIRFNENII